MLLRRVGARGMSAAGGGGIARAACDRAASKAVTFNARPLRSHNCLDEPSGGTPTRVHEDARPSIDKTSEGTMRFGEMRRSETFLRNHGSLRSSWKSFT